MSFMNIEKNVNCLMEETINLNKKKSLQNPRTRRREQIQSRNNDIEDIDDCALSHAVILTALYIN